MNKIIKTLILAAVFCLPAVGAFCVEFTFDIPVMPSPPRIISVTNSGAYEGNGSFTVYADIQGNVQNEICCNGVCQHECEPDCDFSACNLNDFYGEPDPRITPNPACIPNTVDSSEGASTSTCQKSGITNPKLYYYFMDNPATMASTGMTYDATTGMFKGDIPIAAYSDGDLVTYFIAASDSRGNVVTQVPSTEDVPCSSSAVAAWTSTLATPRIDNCAASNSYEQCGKFKSGTPSCTSGSTVNDPTGDTCGSTGAIDTNGNQNKLDITGVSAGIGVGFSELSGQKVVCSKVSLNANAPDIGDNSTPIGAYIMTFYNPDVVDPNPYDPYIPNSYVITYAPGISGVDPNLVKVLWDGECVTNPNHPALYDCKLVNGGSNESRLKITTGDKSLQFIAQDSLPNGKNIVGTSSKSVTMSIQSGNIQLDGGTPFWTVDSSAGLTVVQKNQEVAICSIHCGGIPIAAPLVAAVQTCINGEGVSFVDGECENAATQTTNTCSLTIKPSPDASIVSEYRIYRATTNSADDAVANGVLATISSNLSSTNIYDDVISTLDGKTYYYFFSSYPNYSGSETLASNMSKSECTVEDWVPPEPPQNLSCSTPDGNEGKCNCSWTMDLAADPYIRKFRIVRDTTEITSALPAVQGLTSYDYTDSPLIIGQSYTYYVSAIDAGNNESPAASAVCVPEDRKPPTKVSDFSMFDVSGQTTLDADVKWDGVTDEDASYYNIYKCNNESQETSCITFPHANWIKANSSPITHSASGAEHTLEITDVPETGNKDFEGDYCFWIEACDNCVTAGTCEGTEPNCSGFDTFPSHRVCFLVTGVCDYSRPATPQNVVATPLPEGGKCLLTWDRVTTNSDGYPFENLDYPTPNELDKYAVMSSIFGYGDPPTNPRLYDPVGKVNKALYPSFVHEGLTNGTTYQYYVITMTSGSCSNFSDPQPIITTCTPEDTAAPNAPALTIQLGNSETTCDLSWNAVQDSGPVTYTVHRCDDEAVNCTLTNNFPSDWGVGLGIPYQDITDTELSDFDVDIDSNIYTYCVTVKDEVGNESEIVNGESSAVNATNCAQCEIIFGEPIDPPSNVTATTYKPAGGIEVLKVNYTNSPSYSVAGNTGGHNIYFCEDIECSTKTKINTTLETADHSVTPYEKDFCNKNWKPGTYYIGVSYEDALGIETSIAVSDTQVAVSLVLCDDIGCTGSICAIISISGKFLEKKLVKCTSADPDCKTGVVKAVEAPYEGATVRLVNNSTGEIVEEAYLEPDGSVPLILLDYELSSGTNYKVVIHVPADVYTGLYGLCENPDTAAMEGCDIVVSDSQTQNANNTIKGAAKTVTQARLEAGESAADVFMGNGGEIGNANGDEYINLSDLAAMKTAFGNSAGSRCYRAWADFNLDGIVNLSDLAVLKQHFGETIPVADGETITPTLTQSNAPFKGTADECCLSRTCN